MTDTSQSASVQRHAISKIRQELSKAFDSDKYACEIDYTDREGNQTTRIISPIRFVGDPGKYILALCCGREEPRKFAVERIADVRIVDANEVQMPEAIEERKPKSSPGKVAFTVHGLPKPQGSKRAFMRPGAKHPSVVESAGDALKHWRYAVSQKAADVMNGSEMFRGAVSVEITFHLPRPKGDFGTGKNAGVLKDKAPMHHTKYPDVDKLSRALLDGLAERVYKNDSQVCRLVAEKQYTTSSPRADICVQKVS